MFLLAFVLRCFFNFCARSQVLSSITCGTGISIQVSFG